MIEIESFESGRCRGIAEYDGPPRPQTYAGAGPTPGQDPREWMRGYLAGWDEQARVEEARVEEAPPEEDPAGGWRT